MELFQTCRYPFNLKKGGECNPEGLLRKGRERRGIKRKEEEWRPDVNKKRRGVLRRGKTCVEDEQKAGDAQHPSYEGREERSSGGKSKVFRSPS